MNDFYRISSLPPYTLAMVKGLLIEAKKCGEDVIDLDMASEREKQKAAMFFVWAKIPEVLESMGLIEFSKLLLQNTRVASSPGMGFGEYGKGYVRFALMENEHRPKQAVKSIRNLPYSAEKK
ncbi:MAG: hypothetical protein LBQ00_07660 [Syntrophobacterales bacterium]|jgi:alanine-synthesizing transaminase|nr:hypothetical protein [Syntrophobacterales bacterium]